MLGLVLALAGWLGCTIGVMSWYTDSIVGGTPSKIALYFWFSASRRHSAAWKARSRVGSAGGSPGWRSSFEALLQSQTTAAGGGNAGLAPAVAAHPAVPGFRLLVVSAIDRESADVLSLTMQSPDGQPLPTARRHRALRRAAADCRNKSRAQTQASALLDARESTASGSVPPLRIVPQPRAAGPS